MPAIETSPPGLQGEQGIQGVPGPLISGLLILAGYCEDDSVTNSTLVGIYVEKLKCTFTAEAADYFVEFSAEGKANGTNVNVGVKFELDDTTIINDQIYEPSGSGSSGTYGPMMGFKKITLAAGSHDLDLDIIMVTTGPGTKSIDVRRARIRIFKVTP